MTPYYCCQTSTLQEQYSSSTSLKYVLKIGWQISFKKIQVLEKTIGVRIQLILTYSFDNTYQNVVQDYSSTMISGIVSFVDYILVTISALIGVRRIGPRCQKASRIESKPDLEWKEAKKFRMWGFEIFKRGIFPSQSKSSRDISRLGSNDKRM